MLILWNEDLENNKGILFLFEKLIYVFNFDFVISFSSNGINIVPIENESLLLSISLSKDFCTLYNSKS